MNHASVKTQTLYSRVILYKPSMRIGCVDSNGYNPKNIDGGKHVKIKDKSLRMKPGLYYEISFILQDWGDVYMADILRYVPVNNKVFDIRCAYKPGGMLGTYTQNGKFTPTTNNKTSDYGGKVVLMDRLNNPHGYEVGVVYDMKLRFIETDRTVIAKIEADV